MARSTMRTVFRRLPGGRGIDWRKGGLFYASMAQIAGAPKKANQAA